MKKLNKGLALIIGIALFLVSYKFDGQVNTLFDNMSFTPVNDILGIITNFGVVVAVMLLVPSLMLYKRNKKLVYLLLLTFAVAFILAFIIKLIVLRPRPSGTFTYPFTNIVDYSFPSIHSIVAFSLLPALARHLPRQKFLWITFAFLVAFNRIYFGFHFLSDVVFGAIAGYFIGQYFLELHEKGKLWIK